MFFVFFFLIHIINAIHLVLFLLCGIFNVHSLNMMSFKHQCRNVLAANLTSRTCMQCGSVSLNPIYNEISGIQTYMQKDHLFLHHGAAIPTQDTTITFLIHTVRIHAIIVKCDCNKRINTKDLFFLKIPPCSCCCSHLVIIDNF